MSERAGRSIAIGFRARLALVLTSLLVVTLATVQYLNQLAQQRVQEALARQKASVDDTIDAQFADVIKAANFAILSLSDEDFIYVLAEDKYRGVLNRERIRHILVVRADGEIYDATDAALRYERVALPDAATGGAQLMGFAEKGDPLTRAGGANLGPSDTYWFRLKTLGTQDRLSEYYWIAVIVSTEQVSTAILESQQQLAAVIEETAGLRWKATLSVFVLACILMLWLVWRFTRPITVLSEAAARVAGGDLDFEVHIKRRDEMGHLAATFNAMIVGLKAKAQLEERLNASERAAVIGRLTSAIAHEIRNPLNFINLSMDHVRSKYAPTGQEDRQRFERMITSIKEEITRLNRLVSDVLNFGRPANLRLRELDVRSLIDKVVAVVRTQAEEQQILIDTRLPDRPVAIEADAEKLTSCFSNVAINAVQAMPHGGRLVIEVQRLDGRCLVRFQDSGPGIAPAALDRVFEPYYSTKETGTGLGLAVTRKILEEHHGHIRVESVVGDGTVFEIELPTVESATDLQPAAAEEGDGGA